MRPGPRAEVARHPWSDAHPGPELADHPASLVRIRTMTQAMILAAGQGTRVRPPHPEAAQAHGAHPGQAGDGIPHRAPGPLLRAHSRVTRSVLSEYTRLAAGEHFHEVVASPPCCVAQHGHTLYQGDDAATVKWGGCAKVIAAAERAGALDDIIRAA